MILFPEIIFVASLLTAHVNCIKEEREIDVPNYGEVVIQNPGYPNSSPEPASSLIWTFNSPPGTIIIIECPDVRISPSPNCDKGFLQIKHAGGTTPQYCGSASGVQLTSAGNQMILHFELIWASGVFQCVIKQKGVNELPDNSNAAQIADGDGTSDNGEHQIYLAVGETRYKVIDYKPIPSKEELRWTFTTEPDNKIGIKCPILWLMKYSSVPGCPFEGSVLFDLGNRKVEICNNSKDLTLVSSGHRLSVTINSTKHTNGMIECTVTSTSGQYFEEYKNEPELDEEDSSEHGHPQIPGAKHTTCECGLANKPSSARILHGKDVAPHEFPWMAGLLADPTSLNTFCGGTIITKRHVISAAHCTTRIEASHVVVGMYYLSLRRGGHLIAVEKTINHGYKPSYATSKDISLLILAEEIQFNKNVGPACLPTYDPGLNNKPVVAVGWGLMAQDEYDASRDGNHLKKAKLRVVSMKSCNPVWDGRWSVTPQTQICTWHKNKDVCFGDSGGPVVWLDPETNRYTLVGIPSACDGCILEKPAIHTALHFYYPWILENIKSNNYGEQQVCTKIG